MSISGGKELSESLQSGCLEVLLWPWRLEESNLETMLASSWYQQGKLELQVNQTCFRELACLEQLEVRCAGTLEIIKDPSKNHCFFKVPSAPRWAQEGSRNYLAWFTRWVSHLFEHILSLYGAILGPPWPFSGGLGVHLEADLGLGRLDRGV